MSDRQAQGARTVDAGPEEEGQRLDNFLFRILKGVPKTHVYRVIRKGQVRVNSGRCRPDRKLAPGDRIRVPPMRTATGPRRAPGFEEPVPVLWEDDRFIAYDKPSGLAVHGGSGIAAGLIERARADGGPNAGEYRLAHRLDRDTSGVVIVAKRRSALRRLHELFREGKVTKRYVAVVAGTWEERHRELDAPLAKWIDRKGERIVGVDEKGRKSLTTTRCLRQWDGAAKIEAKLVTGRTHQIRVHLSHCGLPIIGDPKYGDFPRNRAAKARGIARLMLHASEIGFPDPDGGSRIAVRSPLPEEFAGFARLASARADAE